jgi:hypothetical protein
MRLLRRGKEWKGYFRPMGGDWELAGGIVQEEEPGIMEIALKGAALTGSVNFDLDRAVMYRGSGIMVYNLGPGYSAHLAGDAYDVTREPDANGDVFFDLRGLATPFTGTLTIKDNTDTTVFSYTGEHWPGDEYTNECKVQISVGNTVLGPDIPYSLGEFYENQIIADLIIENGEIFDIKNVTVRAIPLLDQSYDWAQYASYDESITALGPFFDLLTIPLIEAGATFDVKMLVTRSENFFSVTARDLSFLTEIGYER